MSKEEEIYQRLKNINTETHQDNQEVLHLLFSLQDDLQLQQYSRQVQRTILFLFPCSLFFRFFPVSSF